MSFIAHPLPFRSNRPRLVNSKVIRTAPTAITTSRPVRPDSSADTCDRNQPPSRQQSTKRPGWNDVRNFQLAPSVRAWRHVRYPIDVEFNPADIMRLLQPQLRRALASGPHHVEYWLSGVGRSIFYCALWDFFRLAIKIDESNDWSTHSTGSAQRCLYENVLALCDDYNMIRRGIYNMPWDIETGSFNMRNKNVGIFAEGLKMFDALISKSSGAKVWLQGDLYPQYYLRSYHYQTDGWLSSSSAHTYEVLSDAMLVGRQDVMQRLTLRAIHDFLNEQGFKGRKLKMVEVAAGTGRFATFVRDNWPNFDYVISDLSPFYLEQARQNMSRWELSRRDGAPRGTVEYIQANAEQLPLPTASVDILYAVFLFHELPPEARRAVFMEAARILKKGGLFVLTDSVQFGDRPCGDEAIRLFGQADEPWYDSYCVEDFAELASEYGSMKPWRKELCSVSKMLSFVRL